jgi:hypothetical protein
MASSATPSSRRWPSIRMGFSGNRGKSPGKCSAHVADARRLAGAGARPRQQKTLVQHGVGMGSRLRGNDAAVLLLTPHVQQSRAIARTFAPFTFSGKRASYFSGTTDDRRASLRLLFADISVAGREQWSSHRNICAIQHPDGSDTRNGHTVIRQIAETARARRSGKRLTRRRNSRSRGMPSVSIESSIGCSFPVTAVHFAGHAYIRATHI